MRDLVSILGMTYEIGSKVHDEWSNTVFTIQNWTIEDILNHVTASSDFDEDEFNGSASSWAFIIASKGGDEWVPDMLELIKENGVIDPITIYRTGLGAYGIGNGHHRLVCAILLGMDSIPVAYTDTDETYPLATDGKKLSGEFADWDSANMIYTSYAKIYKKLRKEEEAALAEEGSSW